MFLHADTVLQGDWLGAVRRHIERHGDKAKAASKEKKSQGKKRSKDVKRQGAKLGGGCKKEDIGVKAGKVVAAKLGLQDIEKVANGAGSKGLKAVVASLGGAEGLVAIIH